MLSLDSFSFFIFVVISFNIGASLGEKNVSAPSKWRDAIENPIGVNNK